MDAGLVGGAKEAALFHFIVLGSLTAQGTTTNADTLKRADGVAQGAQAMGGRLIDIYWTLGKYDFVCLFEMPDAESMAALLMRVGAQGNIKTMTMRAFDRTEMPAILAKAG
jgi:uncharacterized protein with GYD domain